MEAVGLSLQLVQTADKICTFLKSAKNASEELQRVSDTVESLHNISKTVHTILALQQSPPAQGQQRHTPPPLPGVEDSLRQCEEQLRPLEGIIKTHGAALQNESSKLDKLWHSIRLGLKTKDVADFHARLHREMDFLKLWLELNSHHYRAQVLPDIRNDIRMMQQDLLIAIKTSLTQVVPVNDLHSPQTNTTRLLRGNICKSHQETAFLPPLNPGTLDTCRPHRPSVLRQRDDTIDMPLVFRQLGLRRKKVRKYVQSEKRKDGNRISYERVLIAEERVYSWPIQYLRRGIELKFSSLYGTLLPTLSSHPVVPNIYKQCYDLFCTGSLKDLQDAFSSGRLHPFMQDPRGHSMLHLAVETCRVDICQLLSSLGVTVDTGNGDFQFYLSSWNNPFEPQIKKPNNQRMIDTTRFLFQNGGSWQDFSWVLYCFSGSILRWLWDNAPLYFDDCQATEVRADILRQQISRRTYRTFFSRNDNLLEPLGRCQTLTSLFFWAESRPDSYLTGKDWVEFLLDMEVNIEDYFKKELPYGFIDIEPWHNERPRRVRVSCNGDGEWVLGWEWLLDPREPCFLACWEFSAIANETWNYIEWPYSCGIEARFDGRPYWDKYDEMAAIRRVQKLKIADRFVRQMDKRAQKELKKSRKGIPRRMPGAWI